MLRLDRPLVVFDIESTGTTPRKDRIIELAAVKLMPDGTEISKCWLMNPGVKIPPETTKIHGITDEIVKDCPTFADKADEIFAFFEGCDLSGFNADRFDIPCLEEEFARVGKNFAPSSRRHVDVQRIYHRMEPRDLSAAVRFYLGRDHTGALEAAMKYFVLGSLASGVLLYGLSMLYGAAGTLSVNEVLGMVAGGGVKPVALVFALVFVVAGLAFKLGAAPFHMWVPDVYQGAPTAVTLLIGTVPKLAAFAMAIRLLVQGLLPLAQDWQLMLALLATVSLLLGNLAAIMQTNLKRMLAYSTISHMGFVLLGLMSGVVDADVQTAANAYSAAMFYMVTYVLTTLAAFGLMLALARKGFESEEIADFAGLHQRQPLYAAVMALVMFSLAGVPPLAGFQGKLVVLQALVAAGRPLYTALAVFAVLISVVGAFYYLRVIKVMYFDEAAEDTPIAAQPDMQALLALNGMLLLFYGILPGGLLTLCSEAVLRMLQH